jgi:hypothetical protein
MAMEFEFDIEGLRKMLNSLGTMSSDFRNGAKRGLHDVMDDWLKESRDVAPLGSGNLRKQIHTEVDEATLKGTIYGNAVEYSPGYGRFNYGYWLHEVHTGNLSTPGTIHKFLEVPAVANKEKWLRHIESEIKAEVTRKGW